MKIIHLKDLADIGQDTPVKILMAVLGQSPHKTLSVDEMRRRIKIMTAVEEMKDGVLRLEDADHTILAEALTNFPWQVASRPLLKLIDTVTEAGWDKAGLN